MNYELLKELKDAGFAFKEYPEYSAKLPLARYGSGIYFGDGPLYCVPTLPELIEACGEAFKILKHEPNAPHTEQWRATARGVRYEKDEAHPHGAWRTPDAKVFSTRPEEAVARLWLALNKK